MAASRSLAEDMMMDEDPARPLALESWMLRLKAAYEAGYYRTETAEDEQEPFPWQNRTCGDCPFWARNTCLVRASRRGASDATCRYFDSWNHAEAASIIQYNRTPTVWPGDDQAA